MRTFKVQYSQVFEYEVEAPNVDFAARLVEARVQPERGTGFVKVLSIVEAGASLKIPCTECEATLKPGSQILEYWPKKKKVVPTSEKPYSSAG